jgi:hypothetical protein
VTICSAPNLFFGIFLLFSKPSSLNSPGSENAGQVTFTPNDINERQVRLILQGIATRRRRSA